MTHQKPVESSRANAVTTGLMPAGAPFAPPTSSADRHTPTRIAKSFFGGFERNSKRCRDSPSRWSKR